MGGAGINRMEKEMRALYVEGPAPHNDPKVRPVGRIEAAARPTPALPGPRARLRQLALTSAVVSTVNRVSLHSRAGRPGGPIRGARPRLLPAHHPDGGDHAPRWRNQAGRSWPAQSSDRTASGDADVHAGWGRWCGSHERGPPTA